MEAEKLKFEERTEEEKPKIESASGLSEKILNMVPSCPCPGIFLL